MKSSHMKSKEKNQMIVLFFCKNILHKNYTHSHILIKLNIHTSVFI
jgi:hypothetical protein